MNRVVLVTGASRGIGLAVCRQFREQGDWVAGCASSENSLKTLEADDAQRVDVSSREQVEAWVRGIAARKGKIDVVVNNAGLAGENPLEPNSSDELWHRIIDVNLHGTYYVCKAALPYFPESGGRIINISSVLGLKGVPDGTAYCAAKHGVIGWTRALAHAVASRQITVNAVCPGWTRTAMAESRMREIGISEQDLKHRVPLGRFVEPKEIAASVVYLASPGAAAMTGQCLVMDGGVLA